MRRLILDNFGWKLLSLAVAVFLWWVAVGAPDFFLGTLPEGIRRILNG